MKDNEKKPLFEPITPEEAKKIRAYKESRTATSGSGVECPSGSADPFTVCQLSHEGAECCYRNDSGDEVYGVCVYAVSFIGSERLKCTNLPWETDPKHKKL